MLDCSTVLVYLRDYLSIVLDCLTVLDCLSTVLDYPMTVLDCLLIELQSQMKLLLRCLTTGLRLEMPTVLGCLRTDLQANCPPQGLILLSLLLRSLSRQRLVQQQVVVVVDPSQYLHRIGVVLV